jgi:hypothetical protein
MTTKIQGETVAEAFLGAFSRRDWDGLARCFEPDARFRAVVPSERPFRDRAGPGEAAEQLRLWFGEGDHFEVLSSTVEPMADRVRVAYRVRYHDEDGWQLVEQQAYLTIGEAGIRYMNLVCSGFRGTGE